MIDAIPADVAAQIIDIVDRASEDNSYGTLKVLSLVAYLILRRNVYYNCSQVGLGDRTPS